MLFRSAAFLTLLVPIVALLALVAATRGHQFAIVLGPLRVRGADGLRPALIALSLSALLVTVAWRRVWWRRVAIGVAACAGVAMLRDGKVRVKDVVKDIDTLRRCWCTGLDPMAYQGEESGFYNDRLVIDACRPWDRRASFPKVARVSQGEAVDMRGRWPDLFELDGRASTQARSVSSREPATGA
mgnify:CR=1 FL=1